MAISHLCLACGLDLARIRPVRDPHYGLPLILCPECGTGAVRRRHPTIHRWRLVRRTIGPLFAMTTQLVILGGVTALTMLSCMLWVRQLAPGGPPGPDDPAVRGILLGLVGLLCVATGAWLTIGCAHWRRWVAWLTLYAWIAFLMALDVLIVPAVIAVVDRVVIDTVELPYQPGVWLVRMATLGVMLAVGVLGIPVGLACQRGWSALHRQCWRARRRRLRCRRLT